MPQQKQVRLTCVGRLLKFRKIQIGQGISLIKKMRVLLGHAFLIIGANNVKPLLRLLQLILPHQLRFQLVWHQLFP